MPILCYHNDGKLNIQGVGNFTNSYDVIQPKNDSKSEALSNPSSIYQLFETKMASLIRKKSVLEGKLATSLSNQKAAQKNLSSILRRKKYWWTGHDEKDRVAVREGCWFRTSTRKGQQLVKICLL